MNGSESLRARLLAMSRRSAVIGLIAAACCAFAFYRHPAAFFPTYLVAFLFWLGISLGSLAISMLHHVTGGSWGMPIRRIVESGASTIVLMAILFLPLLAGMKSLYVWTHADVVAADEILQRKSHYLNVDDFLIRAAVYFAIWTIWMLLINRLMKTGDADRQYRRQRRLAILSSLGLTLWGLTVTFASVDWAMSLEPHWFSSMYGVMFMAGQAVSALAAAIVVVILINRGTTTVNPLSPAILHDLGNLLLAFVMFWSYVSFMQFLIIWGGDLPEETPWYLQRSQGGWQSVVFFLMTLHFLLPVLLLLVRQVKRREERLIRLALLLLAMRILDLSWLILPTFAPHLHSQSVTANAGHGIGGTLHLLDLWPLVVTLPAIGGLWIAVFCWRLANRVALPVYEFVSLQENPDGLSGSAVSG